MSAPRDPNHVRAAATAARIAARQQVRARAIPAHITTANAKAGYRVELRIDGGKVTLVAVSDTEHGSVVAVLANQDADFEAVADLLRRLTAATAVAARPRR